MEQPRFSIVDIIWCTRYRQLMDCLLDQNVVHISLCSIIFIAFWELLQLHPNCCLVVNIHSSITHIVSGYRVWQKLFNIVKWPFFVKLEWPFLWSGPILWSGSGPSLWSGPTFFYCEVAQYFLLRTDPTFPIVEWFYISYCEVALLVLLWSGWIFPIVKWSYFAYCELALLFILLSHPTFPFVKVAMLFIICPALSHQKACICQKLTNPSTKDSKNNNAASNLIFYYFACFYLFLRY